MQRGEAYMNYEVFHSIEVVSSTTRPASVSLIQAGAGRLAGRYLTPHVDYVCTCLQVLHVHTGCMAVRCRPGGSLKGR